MSRILVAGAGYVGAALAEALAAQGHDVWALRRRPLELAGVRSVVADLCYRSSLAAALPGELDVVVFAAAPAGGGVEAYTETYLRGAENLLAASAAPRFVFTSSTGVYAQRDGEWVDERSLAEGSSASTRVLCQAEALVRARPGGVVVRLSGIYGPARTRLVESVRAGSATYRAEAPEYTNRIHRDDCVGLLALVATTANPPDVIVGVDDYPASREVVLRWLAERLGAPEPRAASGSPAPASNKRCSNARQKALGYELAYPTFREGYAPLVAPTAG